MGPLVLVLPGLAGGESDSILSEAGSELRRIAASGEVYRIVDSFDPPEPGWLGLEPSIPCPSQGVLTVAALGADPPASSVHFAVALRSVLDETMQDITPVPTTEELAVVLREASRLNDSKLTFVKGHDLEHGLVWEEGSVDVQTRSPEEALGQPIQACLPEGDGELKLRRFIDDSVNLLSELELNRRRIDEGHSPINLLWPWGQGFRIPMPVLPLQRGIPAQVHSRSLRLRGLARLVGYRHGDVGQLGPLMRPDWGYLRSTLEAPTPHVVVLDDFARLRGKDQFDEAIWLLGEFDRHFFRHIDPRRHQLDVIATGPLSVALSIDPQREQGDLAPFEERIWEDRRTPARGLDTLVRERLSVRA